MTRAAGLATLRCPVCSSADPLVWTGTNGTCACGRTMRILNGCVQYSLSETLDQIPEVGTRDRHADGYLRHAKFPTQISRVEHFLQSLSGRNSEDVACDLGCGPGPYTSMLAGQGYRVIAVDFSIRSLALNRSSLRATERAAVTYVRADLNELRMAPESVDLLLMCDFLQHLGGQSARTAFLTKAFGWLRSGGRFYLTFFNVNIKNYLKNDLRGSFANGSIAYERLRHRDVVSSLPAGVAVDTITPLNIFSGAMADRLASAIPGASVLSRMIALSGSKA